MLFRFQAAACWAVLAVGVLFVAISLRGRMIERAQPGNLRNQSWAIKMSFIQFGDLNG